MKIEGYITNLGKYNEGELIGRWIEFPIDEDDLKKALEEIGINEEYEEYFITDYENIQVFQKLIKQWKNMKNYAKIMTKKL